MLLAAGLVYKYVSSSLVLASFSRCSPSVLTARARENASIPRTDAKTALVGKSLVRAKCLKFISTKVRMAFRARIGRLCSCDHRYQSAFLIAQLKFYCVAYLVTLKNFGFVQKPLNRSRFDLVCEFGWAKGTTY